LRVLFVSHYALPHVGGIETSIAAVAGELTGRGHDVAHLASAALRPGERDRMAPSPYRVVRVPAANALERRLGVPYPVFSPLLLSALRREVARADVVHAHGFLYLSSAVALGFARRAQHRPLRVLTEHVGHVPYPNAALDRAERIAIATLGRGTARRAEAIATYNARVAGELRELAPGALAAHIVNGVDPERFRPPRAGERGRVRGELGWDERPRVVFVGRAVAKKGLRVALEAAALGGGAFDLVVVGPGVDAPPGAPHVEALGGISPARLADVYRAADAFVLPSTGEGFPLSAQEAMASGLPIVLGDDAAYSDQVAGAGASVRLVSADGPAVAAELTALLADSAACRAAGEAAALHARSAFSWQTAADVHERLYAEVAEHRRAAP
jgi:glycosyltransferase involved in cell wall biosynthesis